MKTVKVAELTIDGLPVTVRWKRIRNTYLRIQRTGNVEVSVPAQTSATQVKQFVTDRKDWIREHVEKAEPQPSFEDGEVHALWGKPVRLALSGAEVPGALLVRAEPGQAAEKKLYARYKAEVAARVPALLHTWVPQMKVPMPVWQVRRMSSRWGSCTKAKQRISLNSELARFRPALLEYVVVHELAHLIEANHSARYYAILDRHMPGWRRYRAELRLPPIREQQKARTE